MSKLTWIGPAVLFLSLSQEANGQGTVSESAKPGTISYRLLRAKRIDFLNMIDYAVSVDTRLSKPEEFEQLICTLLENEKPGDYKSLVIQIFYRLDKYVPDMENPARSQINGEHGIGSYAWNRGLPDDRGRLVIYKDAAGMELPAGAGLVDFDHTRDCKKGPAATPEIGGGKKSTPMPVTTLQRK